ncbi:hypothetical protein NIES2104_27960 [Leptolyngbya sp. NIES-2104]|nr:hypothetical protein NIES2104_27960 [Leptolyngbya sp. NIES-2104]
MMRVQLLALVVCGYEEDGIHLKMIQFCQISDRAFAILKPM